MTHKHLGHCHCSRLTQRPVGLGITVLRTVGELDRTHREEAISFTRGAAGTTRAAAFGLAGFDFGFFVMA